MTKGFAADLQDLDAENIFVYVGDAVRWDCLPRRIAERGTVRRTVASSIHSPASFASLVTGLHPPSHGVHSFTHTLEPSISRLFDLNGYETRFVNSVREQGNSADPIFAVLGVEPDHDEPFADLSKRFAVMERGPGGHAPYDRRIETAPEYFQTRRGTDTSTIRSEYRSSVAADADLFERRLTELEERGVLDDTLVVYTSDHGELVGEGGMLGHNAPMRPELVYVPSVFIHPNLPTGRERSDEPFRHVDLLPTVLAALGEYEEWTSLDGTVGTEDHSIGPTFYKHQFLETRDSTPSLTLAYNGVWTDDGGYVFARTNRAERLAVLAGKLVTSAKRGYLRRHVPAAFRSYAAGDRTFGSPECSLADATSLLSKVRTAGRNTTERELSESAVERLHDMGYI